MREGSIFFRNGFVCLDFVGDGPSPVLLIRTQGQYLGPGVRAHIWRQVT
jgi:hypothetical protein